MTTKRFRKHSLSFAVSMASLPIALAAAPAALAQAGVKEERIALEEVIVTASRRQESVQDIALNISAVTADKIEDLRLNDLADIAHYVPGLAVIDRGPRNSAVDLLVRGLNTTSLGPGFVSSRTTATYLGEVPIDIDLKPVDLERLEVLIGPQGTLYGQGTMGGAIRYIPKEADASEFSGELRGDVSQVSESSSMGYEAGVTLNVPILKDMLAIRANVDYFEDPGFIDYNYVVREGGVSNPEPDLNNPTDVAANLRQVEDANGETTVATRVNLRFMPTDGIDSNLWYYFQDSETEGRQVTNRLSFGTGDYESGARYEEPNDYSNELISFDTSFDLGIAEATVVYGKSKYEEVGQRDQTDLLLSLDYGYDAFPSFSSFTREEDEQDSETFELRFVSQHGGPVSWVVGVFDNTFEQDATSLEFTPGYDEFALDPASGGQLRPDDVEYVQLTDVKEDETAFYGEVTYQFIPQFSATIGYRRYRFSVDSAGGFGTPLARTVFGFIVEEENEDGELVEVRKFADPLASPESFVTLGQNQGSDSGDLFKFNLSYNFNDDGLVYFTYSEGYRNGGVNAVPACTEEQLNAPEGEQKLCAQQDEVFIDPDTIDNYEIGYKGTLADGTINITSALYYIDWEGLQVSTTTEFGSLPITGNGSTARSQGLEFQGAWSISSNWEASLTYAFTDADLTADAPGLVGSASAYSGARLPGHAEHQGSFNLIYTTDIFSGIQMDINYGVVFQSNVYNIVGGDEDPLFSLVEMPEDSGMFVEVPEDRGGEAIPGFEVHHLSANFSKGNVEVQAYIDNLLDEYYIVGTRTTRDNLVDENSGPGVDWNGFTQRSYGEYVGESRKIGMNFIYRF